ncbi:MAG TPA: DUF2459 domain-containing protein, partial [Cytophagales bacterium]|nr:DUF2459 domain-containing protein [Cytophagales bacterium]
MRIYLFNTLKYFFRAFMVLIILVGSYILAIFISLWFPANRDFDQSKDRNIPIYIVSNGVHTDVLLPTDTGNALDSYLIHKQGQGMPHAYIAYGWGDKGFYLETPTWAD